MAATKRKPVVKAEAAETPTVDGGILANDHDVDRLGEQIGKLLAGLAERGVMVDIAALDLNNVKARVEAEAACRMLVAKGIATQAEMAATCNQIFKDILAAVLQAVEERQLQQPGAQVARPAGAGKLAVVRR